MDSYVSGRFSRGLPFLGREHELALLRGWGERAAPSCLTVLYGRRRIGKTRLIEEAFAGQRLVKIEGVEGRPAAEQQRLFAARLAEIGGRAGLATVRAEWIDLLRLLSDAIGRRRTVVLLDEFQWLAAGRTRLVGALKYVWDNQFARRNAVHLILCGSVGSFLVRKVLRSRALYGRVDLEIDLPPLSLPEIKPVFSPGRSLRDVVELYMCLGGVPRYLEMIDPAASPRANLARLCFSRSGPLAGEFERLFVSHFAGRPIYRRLIEALALRPHASRRDLQAACGLGTGGRLTEHIEELEMAGLVERYTPVHRPDAQRLVRFRIADPFVGFHFRFIRPALGRIRRSRGPAEFSRFVSDRAWRAWRALAFERLCHQHHELLAERLGFSAVRYTCGPWFSRSDQRTGAQVDLLFSRDDGVITLCELKFQEAPIGVGVIAEVDDKVARLPNPRGLTVERVLITASEPTRDLARERYFHRILRLEDVF